MTEPAQVPYAHEFVPGGSCGSDACSDANHVVCAVCGGGETAFNHLPEARGEAVPQATVQAGAAATVPVQHADAGSGGEATK